MTSLYTHMQTICIMCKMTPYSGFEYKGTHGRKYTSKMSGQKIGVICCRYSLVKYNRYNTKTQLHRSTVYPKKYAHVFVVRCFVVVMQSFIMNSHEVFIHIHQGCFAGTGAIVRLPQCQWSKPDGYGAISQCITTTKHSKAKTVCIFRGIYCRNRS